VHLAQLAGANDVGGAADGLTGVGRFKRAGQVKGMRKQEIADQNAGLVVAAGIDRLTVASETCLVQHVVVHECRRVDHFHHGGQHDVVATDGSARLGRQQQQGRPQPLAAQSESVFHQAVDERIVAR
jgi:hypothetical protein